MRLTRILLTLMLLTGLAACGGSTLPTSSLTIRDAITDALISAPTAQGVLTLAAGETVQIKVLRTYRSDTGNTFTDDVTQFTNFKWESDAGVATIDQLGNVAGVGTGIAVLEAKFRENSLDPWDICRLTVEVQ
jgi:hypothetical protein